MTEPILQAFCYDQVFPNPYQLESTRRFQGPDFDDLVDSIREDGIHQKPSGRPHPTLPGAVQLKEGHRRLAAARVGRPDDLFYIVVDAFDDLEMFIGCVQENIHRSDLNDIERAQMVEAYKTLKPEATNADMARVFKLKDPASITNIRKLLHLPAGIQKHVAENAIPDAIARQLVAVAKINSKTAQKIADDVAAAPKSEKASVFENESQHLFWGKTESLDDADWPLDWLELEPKEVTRDLGDGDHFLGACAGCVFRISDRCARKTCFDEKLKLWSFLETQRVSAEKKIPVAVPEEKAQILFQGNYGDDESAAQLLNSRKEIRATLRLAPFEGHRHNTLSRLLGTHCVTLASVDVSACREYVAERANGSKVKSIKVEKPAEETEAQKAKRIEAEKTEQAANRAARSKMWKSKYDALWLVENASVLVGAQLEIGGTFLQFAEALFRKEYKTYGAIPLALADPLVSKIFAEKDERRAAVLRRQHIALCVLGCNVSDGNGHPDYEQAHEHILDEIAFHPTEKNKWGFQQPAHGFGVTLPAGWDVPPIHKTEFNCWHCGKFAGNTSEKLTQRDINEDGWINDGENGVFCSQAHQELYLASADQPTVSKTKAGKRASGGAKKAKRKK